MEYPESLIKPGETKQVPIPPPPGPFIVPGVALLPVTEKPCYPHPMVSGTVTESKY